MIAAKHRFHGHNSLSYVYQHGQTVRAGLGTLKYALNKRRDSYRLAVVVSKKVQKSAVVRNRIRRRIYEAVRAHEAELIRPYDLVITVFQENVASLPATELQANIDRLLGEAKVLARPLKV